MAENENVKSTSEEVEVAAVENIEETSADNVTDSAVEAVESSEEIPAAEENQSDEAEPAKENKFLASVKEWFRKRIVKLKHKPQTIPFVILLITSFMYLCFLGTLSPFITTNRGVSGLGIFQFVNTLASILIILIFLNSFPKRKKVNIVFLVITFVVLALMIVMDIMFIVNIAIYANRELGMGNEGFQWFLTEIKGAGESVTCTIVHMVFLVITTVVLALLPVYKMLLLKINTRKELASNDIKEEIDTSEENG